MPFAGGVVLSGAGFNSVFNWLQNCSLLSFFLCNVASSSLSESSERTVDAFYPTAPFGSCDSDSIFILEAFNFFHNPTFRLAFGASFGFSS